MYTNNGFSGGNGVSMLTIGLTILVVTIVVVIVIVLSNKGDDSDDSKNIDKSRIICKESDISGELECECKPGFWGDYCEQSEDTECLDYGFCYYNGKPRKKNDTCVCDCYPDFEGAWCQKRRSDVYKVKCSGFKICCKNGKMCDTSSLSKNSRCEQRCMEALDSDDPKVKLSADGCECN
tara:strand:+ start:5804 stop:6340 length:537 start_codon:yes stop_codon:yes gene_type:complete